MSTRILRTTYRRNGVLTDADSVVLRDPTDTFGVQRLDTLATVVAAGVAMTRVSEGVYEHSFEDPAPGLTYRWYRVLTYNGVEQSAERFSFPPVLATGTQNQMSKWSVVVPSLLQPVTWAEAKAHLRLDGDAEQAYVETLIEAAVDHAQDRLSEMLMPQTIAATFYGGERLLLPRGPVRAITSVVDRDDADVGAYTIVNSAMTTEIVPESHGGYPIGVTYEAGYPSASAIPASVLLGIKTHVATLFENRESVSERGRVPVPHGLDSFYRMKSRFTGVG